MDQLINELPFFSAEHRTLAQSIAKFAELEVEPHAVDELDVEDRTRKYVQALAKAGTLEYAVAKGSELNLRAVCLIREALAYSSALADLAFVMQGLGTYAISRAATEHVGDFWLGRAAQ